ncbi:unnamed protein product [Hermetia illucens]|uniref:Complex 1 LYR protein domain-containing protein n=1 Tax=Hermetia illucens TaxID=343691 RepID=A0A7R8UVM5_HERIL|nr:MIEF1 upstream open reading frame protein [Hermetia illucens]CAD7087952.1 unnamed protein product [Hermetia illucens]
MVNPSRQQVLKLYKHLIRYGHQLKYTDKNYFLSRIRDEFRENKDLKDPKEIEFFFKRGETLLRNGRVI